MCPGERGAVRTGLAPAAPGAGCGAGPLPLPEGRQRRRREAAAPGSGHQLRNAAPDICGESAQGMPCRETMPKGATAGRCRPPAAGPRSWRGAVLDPSRGAVAWPNRVSLRRSGQARGGDGTRALSPKGACCGAAKVPRGGGAGIWRGARLPGGRRSVPGPGAFAPIRSRDPFRPRNGATRLAPVRCLRSGRPGAGRSAPDRRPRHGRSGSKGGHGVVAGAPARARSSATAPGASVAPSARSSTGPSAVP